MFDLERKNNQGISFDLESELKGPNGSQKSAELKKLAIERIETIKSLLRSGESKEEFEKLEILLNGYNALSQIIDRSKK